VDDQPPSGGITILPGDLQDLEARWTGCWTPPDVAQRLAGSSVHWYVAAGWALDLFRGGQTREHHDIEIGVPAGRFPEVRERFAGFAVDAVGSGRIWPSATAQALSATHQIPRDPVRTAGTGASGPSVARDPRRLSARCAA
jgi:hypothetical protein